MERKIYIHGERVSEMKAEFRARLDEKREIIRKMKHLCKEYSLRDVMILCGKCDSDVSLLKTVEYKSAEYHYAKCIFGHLKRVEVQEALRPGSVYQDDPDNRDFV